MIAQNHLYGGQGFQPRVRSYIDFQKHPEDLRNQSRTNGPINAHLTIAQVMPRYNHNNEKQEALLYIISAVAQQ